MTCFKMAHVLQVRTLSVFHIASNGATSSALFCLCLGVGIVIHPMLLLPAEVQIPPLTSRHIHLHGKAAAATASAAPTSQEDNDWLSIELRDGHTKIPNPDLQEDGS